jgi:hypothetical protein
MRFIKRLRLELRDMVCLFKFYRRGGRSLRESFVRSAKQFWMPF